MKPQKKPKKKVHQKKSAAVSRPLKGRKIRGAEKTGAAAKPKRARTTPLKTRGRAQQPIALPPPAVAAAPARRKAPEKIPSILLEGDKVPYSALSGPGTRCPFLPGTRTVESSAPITFAEDLPEGYGTERVFLTPRDPHCLYAYWDLSREQRQKYNALSADGHLGVRVYSPPGADQPVLEVHVHPESQGWFLNVPEAGKWYVAELGFFSSTGDWHPISRSEPASTPPDTFSAQTEAEFAEIPVNVSFEELVEAAQPITAGPIQDSAPRPAPEVKPGQSEEPLELETTEELQLPETAEADFAAEETVPQSASEPAPQTISFSATPIPEPAATAATQWAQAPAPPPNVPLAEAMRAWVDAFLAPAEDWTSAQANALADMIDFKVREQIGFGSLEAAELARAPIPGQVSSAAAPLLGRVVPPGEQAPELPGVSSEFQAAPLPFPPGEKPFWFNINAELIIYGATERDARVTIGGRPIRLRPDGTFSLRFSLPDGEYDLPVEALSADLDHGRAARLRFSRATAYRGEVAAHPQDPRLQPPHPENVA